MILQVTMEQNLDKESFEATNYWVKEVNDITGKKVIIALVGNKLDLEQERVVKKQEGEKLAQENNMSFVEVSACTGENLTGLFEEIGRRVIEEIPAEEKQKPDGCNFLITFSNSIRATFEF